MNFDLYFLISSSKRLLIIKLQFFSDTKAFMWVLKAMPSWWHGWLLEHCLISRSTYIHTYPSISGSPKDNGDFHYWNRIRIEKVIDYLKDHSILLHNGENPLAYRYWMFVYFSATGYNPPEIGVWEIGGVFWPPLKMLITFPKNTGVPLLFYLNWCKIIPPKNTHKIWNRGLLKSLF